MSGRTVATTFGAVLLGDALRRVVLAILGEPWRDPTGPALAAFSGLLAGTALALSRGRSPVICVLLALVAASIDRGTQLLLEVASVGAAFYELVPGRHLAKLAVEAAGLVSLLLLAPRKGRVDLSPASYAGYALFALSRIGPGLPDKYFLVDVLGALETFQLLRKWRPGLELAAE